MVPGASHGYMRTYHPRHGCPPLLRRQVAVGYALLLRPLDGYDTAAWCCEARQHIHHEAFRRCSFRWLFSLAVYLWSRASVLLPMRCASVPADVQCLRSFSMEGGPGSSLQLFAAHTPMVAPASDGASWALTARRWLSVGGSVAGGACPAPSPPSDVPAAGRSSKSVASRR